MIDPNIIAKDLRAMIGDWPVTLRYKGRAIIASLQSQASLTDVMESGLLDDASLTIIGVAADFGKAIPENEEDIDLLLPTGKYHTFKITNVPDRYDPIDRSITLVLGSPDK